MRKRYNFLPFRKFNIITFPKVGCTQIIKYCSFNKDMKDHQHSWESNFCSKYETIHKCAKQSFEENYELEYII